MNLSLQAVVIHEEQGMGAVGGCGGRWGVCRGAHLSVVLSYMVAEGGETEQQPAPVDENGCSLPTENTGAARCQDDRGAQAVHLFLHEGPALRVLGGRIQT